MYKVKAKLDRTAYRSRHSTEQVTRVALVKATKHKGNPATDEVRVCYEKLYCVTSVTF